MRYVVDFPDPSDPGHFLNEPEEFDSREEAEEYCKQWGAVNGKLDLISEIERDEPPRCGECGRDTKGNFTPCESCGKVLCDGCDVRRVHADSAFCAACSPTVSGVYVEMVFHVPDDGVPNRAACDGLNENMHEHELSEVIDWTYGKGLDEVGTVDVEARVLLRNRDYMRALHRVFDAWTTLRWGVTHKIYVKIPGAYKTGDFTCPEWLEEQRER